MSSYDDFLEQVEENGAVWSLRGGDGWVQAEDAQGTLFPVWPDREAASACAIAEWAGFEPAPIGLEEWVARWLPGLGEKGVRIQVFPTPLQSGTVVDPEDLRDHLSSQEP